MSDADHGAAATDREVVSTRLINASPERVFAAYTDPEQLARWWGPKDFRNTFHEFDPRPGGQWRFTMHGPDGTDYKNHSVFVEVTPPERIVFEHRSGPVYRGTVELTPEGDGARLTYHMLFESATFLERLRAVIVRANEQNFDRLEAVLGIRPSS